MEEHTILLLTSASLVSKPSVTFTAHMYTHTYTLHHIHTHIHTHSIITWHNTIHQHSHSLATSHRHLAIPLLEIDKNQHYQLKRFWSAHSLSLRHEVRTVLKYSDNHLTIIQFPIFNLQIQYSAHQHIQHYRHVYTHAVTCVCTCRSQVHHM